MLYRDRCEEKGVTDAASYHTFARYVRNRSLYERIYKRAGAKRAYTDEPQYWELDYTTPRNGQMPFELAHVDSTPLEIFFKDGEETVKTILYI